MPTAELIRRLHEFAGSGPDVSDDPDSLIGVFQSFRPDGGEIRGMFDMLQQQGAELESRLTLLFEAAGDDRRPQGGRDAYFVVRNPPPLDPEKAKDLAGRWLAGIHSLAINVGDSTTAEALDPTPMIRVLEGIPPKHPKQENEKSELLKEQFRNSKLPRSSGSIPKS